MMRGGVYIRRPGRIETEPGAYRFSVRRKVRRDDVGPGLAFTARVRPRVEQRHDHRVAAEPGWALRASPPKTRRAATSRQDTEYSGSTSWFFSPQVQAVPAACAAHSAASGRND